MRDIIKDIKDCNYRIAVIHQEKIIIERKLTRHFREFLKTKMVEDNISCLIEKHAMKFENDTSIVEIGYNYYDHSFFYQYNYSSNKKPVENSLEHTLDNRISNLFLNKEEILHEYLNNGADMSVDFGLIDGKLVII